MVIFQPDVLIHQRLPLIWLKRQIALVLPKAHQTQLIFLLPEHRIYSLLPLIRMLLFVPTDGSSSERNKGAIIYSRMRKDRLERLVGQKASGGDPVLQIL